MSHQLKSCGFVIVREQPQREVLLMEHADRLDLPKGHVDQGETDMQCALRELQEETGITADDIAIDPDFRFVSHYPVRRKKDGVLCDKTLIVFLGMLQREREQEIYLTEHIGYRWLPWAPPHQLQAQTIDPLLAELARHFAGN